MVLAAAPAPPLPAHSLLVLLTQCGVLLGLAVVLGRLAVRVRLPAVAGELCAGVLLGPSVLAHVAPPVERWLFPADPNQIHLLDAVGQLGVLLLVGLTGIAIDLAMVRRRSAVSAAVSLGGLLIPLGAGVGLGFLLPADLAGPRANPAVFALFLGVAMGVSAIPVIAKILTELRMLHRDIGQLILSAAMVDDVIGWVLLSLVSAMATVGVRTLDLGYSLLAVGIVIAVAAVLVRPLSRRLPRPDSVNGEGKVTAVVVMLILIAGAGTQSLGLEAVFGAFVCGIAIGSGKPDVSRGLRPLRTAVMWVFAPLFFATAGLRMDLTRLVDPVVLAIACATIVVAVAGKFLGAYAGARLGKLNRWEAFALGSGLNTRGVIQVIVAATGLRLGVLSTDMYTIIVLVAVVTSVMAAPCLHLAMRHLEVTEQERAREKRLAH
jgi:Kef-type K+ transport system membrane component KefB